MQLHLLDKSSDRKYFTTLPNILWAEELELSPLDLILYATIKKVAGEQGTCFMSTKTLAKQAKMSTGSVSKSKQSLLKAKLIEIVTKRRSANGHPIDHITIKDIWPRNVEYFTKRSPHERNRLPSERTPPQHRSPGERNRSLGETEEEPMKKNQGIEEKEVEERKTTASASASHPKIYKWLSDFGVAEPWLSKLSNDNLNPQSVWAWILYLDTQDMPRKPGYLVKRLRSHQLPPANFLALATLTDEQVATLERAANLRHWSGYWHQSLADLDEAGIDEELAEIWYQEFKT